VSPVSRYLLAGVFAGFFLSGATGLVYAVLWLRMLGLVFGHTVFAVTTVLTAVMAGVGLGSWIFGRIADRQARPLRLYGLLEIGVGILCLLVPAVLPWVETVYRALARGLGLSFLAFSLAQFALILVLLLPPTTLMGATLPILSRVFATEAHALGRRVGFLYAVNMLGAMVGTGLAGYALLPALGMQATLVLAAAVNLAVGALIVVVDWRLALPAPTVAPAPAAPAAPAAGPPGLAITLITAGLAVAGAASTIYVVAWVRALSLVIGSSTYAFTAMLLAFLLGLALGSALFSRLFGDRALSPAAFGYLQLGAGVSALGILPLFDRLPDVVIRALSVSTSPGFVLLVEVTLAVAAVLVPTLLIGAGFPCAVQVASRGPERVGGDVGRLYATNTLGAIAGTVVAGFALVPTLGAEGAVKAAIVLNLVLGLGLVLATGRTLVQWQWQWFTALTLAGVIGVGLVRVPTWDPTVMASGASMYARHYRRFAGHGGVTQATADSRLLFYRDGLTATVSVHREGSTTFLRINGQTGAGDGVDMHTQLMLGHLPMLLHPDARSVLVIGLGSGVTVGAVLAHPVSRVDIVEIEPAVVEAAGFFQREHRNALRDRRAHVAIGDARNVILAGDRRWDVIVSEPTDPWIGGAAALFSAEFYALARSRLTPGGVMMQWVDGASIRPADVKMIARTFRSAFPATTVWQAHGVGDFLLMGSAESRPLDLGHVQAAWEASPGLREDFQRLGHRAPWAFLADFLLAEPDVARLTLGADLNTDDVLPLEFSAPRGLYRDSAAANYRMVRSFRSLDLPRLAESRSAQLDTPAVRHEMGAAYLRKDLPAEAAAQFERALASDPAHVPSLVELGRAQLRLGLPVRAVETLQAALQRDGRHAGAYALLARAWEGQQLAARALEAAGTAVRLAPDEPAHRLQHAALLMQHGRLADAVEEYLVARTFRPRDPALLDGLAAAYTRLGRGPEAVAALEEAVALEPGNGETLHRLGRAYLAVNRPGPAVQTLTRAVMRAPMLAQAHADLGAAQLAAGAPVAAIAALDRALAVDPALVAAAQLRAEINAKLTGGKTP
jgi:spermidine synthase